MPIRHSPFRRASLASAGALAHMQASAVQAGEIYTGLLSGTALGGYDPVAYWDPMHWRIVDNRLCLDYDAKVQSDWEKDIPGEIAKADANWSAVLSR